MSRTFLICFLIFVFCGLVFASAQIFDMKSGRPIVINQWRYQYGDDARWAQVNYADSSWARVDLYSFRKEQSGIHWYRAEIGLTGEPVCVDLIALHFLSVPMAFEIYWDGVCVGKNGTVGTDSGKEIS